jgi:hypothetical protein
MRDAHSLTTTQLCSTVCQLACREDLDGTAAANSANRQLDTQQEELRALGQHYSTSPHDSVGTEIVNNYALGGAVELVARK